MWTGSLCIVPKTVSAGGRLLSRMSIGEATVFLDITSLDLWGWTESLDVETAEH